MAGGYRQVRDTRSEVKWVKNHRNGDRTEVVAKKSGGSWAVSVIDFVDAENPMGLRTENTVASAQTKSDAKKRAKQWMQSNPKGLLSGPFG